MNRRGFTLLEVALAAVMGLVIVAGAYYGYQVNKARAGDANAKRRLAVAQSTIEAYAAGNGGRFPTSGEGHFSRGWAAAHPEERGVSPWGGPTGDPELGACEDPPFTDGSAERGAAPDKTAALGVDGARQSNLHYVNVVGNGHVRVATTTSGDAKTLRGYVLSIYDGQGRPWFDALGAK